MAGTIDPATLRTLIEEMCDALGAGKTLCPSDVARAAVGDDGPWRSLLSTVRREAATLAGEGRIAIYRKGKPVPPDAMKGVIRLGLPPAGT